jgi:hypothetical protein
MLTLQHDEMWTQGEILEKETSPHAEEANKHSEADPGGSRYVIDFMADENFGERHPL